MPSLKVFHIEFDQPDAIYTPGEIVSGNVIVDLTSEKTVRALKLIAKGEAIVNWKEETSTTNTDGHTIDSTINYRGKEEYFRLIIPLIGKSEGDGKVHLPVGLNKYPFCVQLPRNIPCSFEHEDGYIRYTIKAVIDRPWRFNHECKATFTVIAIYDLNIRPQRCVGIFDEIDKNFCCYLCFGDGSMSVHIRLPMTGFVPGQWIEAILGVRNTSRVNLEKISVKLEQSLKLYAKSLFSTVEKQNKSIVTSMQKLGPFDKYAVITLHLQIPSVPPSELEFCSIIHLTYNLHITLHVSGMHYNITKKYPILIGTIPLRFVPSAPEISPSAQESQSTSQIMSIPSEFNKASSAPHPDSSSMNAFPDAPPSYEECCTNKDHNNSKHYKLFAPRYPVFKFATPYPSEKY